MRSTAVTLAMMLTPALLFAQASATATTSANAEFQAPSSFSARDRANLDATLLRARADHVPEQPIRDRVAKEAARGASNEQILVATGMLEARMAASQQAMIRAGHTHPTDAEVERGAAAQEAGYTSAQIEAVARRTPPDRSLVVALDVLTKLAARGAPTTRALALVEARLDQRASDETLASLATSADADAAATANADHGAPAGVNAGANAAAGVHAAAHGVGSTSGAITGSVGGAVTGVLGHRP